MRLPPLFLLALLVAACGPSEVAVEEAGRKTGSSADPAAAPQPSAPIDLGDGLLLAVEERGSGDFVRSGGRLRVHYRARLGAVAAAAPDEPTELAEVEVSPVEGEGEPEVDEPVDEAAPLEEPPAVEVEESAPEDEAALAPSAPAYFDSSFERGVPDVWNLSSTAQPRLIEGLRRGLVGLTVGSRLTLTIPAALAWGEDGLRTVGVPPHTDVVYEIEILEVLP